MSRSQPERIGRYEVIQPLGQGGMGTVYLATDPLLKRRLAIKVVRDPGSDALERVLERFQREAEISAQLSHPNIITVFDVGEDPNVGPFLAMEFVDGQSLAFLMRERRPSLETGLFLLLQAMRGLQAAHLAGIIHRDVKPENMLVSEGGHLKLMDFGLARGEHSRLTATGAVLGTPAFTAPEMIMGAEPSQATDRYAFCVTAFELVTGELPYKGDSIGTTLYRIVHEPPSMPQGLLPELGEVFRKCLSKDPALRPQNLADFMNELIRTTPISAETRRRLLGFMEMDGLARPLPTQTPPSDLDGIPTMAVSPPKGLKPGVPRPPKLPAPRVVLPTPPRGLPPAPKVPALKPKPLPPLPRPSRNPLPTPIAPVLDPVPEAEDWNAPFADVDWDAVLAPASPDPRTDLALDLEDVDVLAAEEHAEAEEAVEDLQHLLETCTGNDVLEAEDRAEVEESKGWTHGAS